MSLFISALNSGSNGNCYYIGNEREAVLVDAGISCRETEKRMKRLGLNMEQVRAIFVSHEHADHITGIPGLSKKYQLPVFITQATLKGSGLPIQEQLVSDFKPDEPIRVGGLTVTAFFKSHDAADPHSFVVSDGNTRVGVFTDIGICCERVIKHFSTCHAVFLESNYCADMLENGRYPYFLKRRISGDNGHLSNTQALELFRKHRGKKLSHLILSHLSKNNNDPQLVDGLFRKEAGTDVAIIVASRYAETDVYKIEPELTTIETSRRRMIIARPAQLSLFDQ